MHLNQFKKYVRQILTKPSKKIKQNELPFGYDEESRHIPQPSVLDIAQFIKDNMPRAYLGSINQGQDDESESSDVEMPKKDVTAREPNSLMDVAKHT